MILSLRSLGVGGFRAHQVATCSSLERELLNQSRPGKDEAARGEIQAASQGEIGEKLTLNALDLCKNHSIRFYNVDTLRISQMFQDF